MNRKLRIAGLALASLTFSTVAMAQQGGGGSGGRGGGDGAAGGSGGDTSVIELRLQDHERARLTRALERRRPGGNCLTHVCNEPPPRRPPARAEVALHESCGGGDRLLQRDYAGRIIRIDCVRF